MKSALTLNTQDFVEKGKVSCFSNQNSFNNWFFELSAGIRNKCDKIQIPNLSKIMRRILEVLADFAYFILSVMHFIVVWVRS